MDFILYYTVTRASHGRMYKEPVKAKNAMAAFKQARQIMKDSNMVPDDFSSFYVSPKKIDWSKSYNLQRHGWDRVGDFPR